MIKKEITRLLYERHGGLSMAQIEAVTQTLIDLLREGLCAEEDVLITNFGKFRKKKTRERRVVLPNGAEVLTQSSTRIRFFPSPRLKALINARDGKEKESG